MARRKKLNVDLTSIESLQELMQEVYYDACGQVKEAQNTINKLTSSAEPEDVDDHTKIAKAKTDALKIKDSAIKIKLDVGKLQNDVLKQSGDLSDGIEGIKDVEKGQDTLASFDLIKEMIKKNNPK
jgi:hypothetical protein